MRRTKVIVTHSRDHQDGTKIVSIPMTNVEGKEAVLYLEDFMLLRSLMVDIRWRLAANVVLAKGKEQLSIARIITNAKSGERVQYLDGNSLNLRRSNLVVTLGGAARSNARDALLAKPASLERFEIEEIYINPPWKE